MGNGLPDYNTLNSVAFNEGKIYVSYNTLSGIDKIVVWSVESVGSWSLLYNTTQRVFDLEFSNGLLYASSICVLVV